MLKLVHSMLVVVGLTSQYVTTVDHRECICSDAECGRISTSVTVHKCVAYTFANAIALKAFANLCNAF